MRLKRGGGSFTAPELTKVASEGIGIRVDGRDLFLPYDLFPFFRNAARSQVALIERPTFDHFRWPELDVDLELDSILHPERYPLVFWPDPPEAE